MLTIMHFIDIHLLFCYLNVTHKKQIIFIIIIIIIVINCMQNVKFNKIIFAVLQTNV